MLAKIPQAQEAAGDPLEALAGDSGPMRALRALVRRVAASDSTVLVLGESGTGKELVAQSIHRLSARGRHAFVPVNCGAIPHELLESELFGHTKGAFTGALTDRRGRFEMADSGTLFLDEIGDMRIEMQVKLLRVLQDKRVRKVGGTDEVEVDVRVIAATNSPLEALVRERRFREDLFYRINVIHLELPPLRARGRDILLLAQSFVEHFAAQSPRDVRGLSPAAAQTSSRALAATSGRPPGSSASTGRRSTASSSATASPPPTPPKPEARASAGPPPDICRTRPGAWRSHGARDLAASATVFVRVATAQVIAPIARALSAAPASPSSPAATTASARAPSTPPTSMAPKIGRAHV